MDHPPRPSPLIILIVIWPVATIPAGKFTESYFFFWVLAAIAWGFGAAIIITVLPLLRVWRTSHSRA